MTYTERTDVLSNDPHREGPNAIRPRSSRVHLELGMVLEDVASSWVGAVVRVEKSGGVHLVELEDRRGRTRSFPVTFWGRTADESDRDRSPKDV